MKQIVLFLALIILNTFSTYSQVTKYAKTGGNGVNGETGGVTNSIYTIPFDPNVNPSSNKAYSASQTIYKYAEIGTYGVISEVGWHHKTGDFEFGINDNLKVYLKTTSSTTPNSTCNLSQYTLVFNGNPNSLGNPLTAQPNEFGWKRVVITPFTYSSPSPTAINLDVVVILSRNYEYDDKRFTSYFWNDSYSPTTSSPTAIYQSTSPFVSNSSTLTKIGKVPRASFKFSSASGLPISLLSFNATPNQQGVSINWSTASERNNDYFTISRSSDLENWEEVGTVKGSGSINYKQDYNFTDIAPLDGVSYYRLKQTDYNGENESFDPVSVEINANRLENALVVYPNPTKVGFDVQVYAKSMNLATVSVHNVAGKSVINQTVQLEKGKNIVPMKNEKLEQGVYLVKIQFEDGTACLTKLVVD